MPKSLDVITRDVLELSSSERLDLARVILERNGGVAEPGAEAAWDMEIRTRLKAFDAGEMETMSYEEFRTDMDRQFGR